MDGLVGLIPNDIIKIFKCDWKIECISTEESAIPGDIFQSTIPI